MIKLGIKNYFKSYRLFFMPIGALSLGIVIGLSIFLPALFGAIKAFFSGAVEIIGDIKPNWDAVWETIAETFRAVDYSDVEIAMRTVFNRDFFAKLWNDCIHAAIDFDALQAQFEELFSACAVKAIAGGIAFAVFTVLGALVGVVVTRVEIRRNIAQRKFWKFVLISILHAVINATIIAAGAWLISKFHKYAILSGFMTLLLYGLVAFFEAYLVHGYKKVPLKKVLRIRNVLSLALLSVIEVAIGCAIVAVVYFISNAVIAFFVGFSVVVLTLSCVSMNAEAYVKDMAGKGEKEVPAPPARQTTPAPIEKPAEAPAEESAPAEKAEGGESARAAAKEATDAN